MWSLIACILLGGGLGASAAAPAAAPSNVSWSVDPAYAVPSFQTGRIAVAWSAPPAAAWAAAGNFSGAPVDRYVVAAAPLDYADPLDALENSNFIVDAGDAPGGEAVQQAAAGGAGFTIATHALRSATAGGRGAPPTPQVLRKLPLLANLVEVTVSCAGLAVLPSWTCGVAVVNGATNSSLFTFGLSARWNATLNASMPALLAARGPTDLVLGPVSAAMGAVAAAAAAAAAGGNSTAGRNATTGNGTAVTWASVLAAPGNASSAAIVLRVQRFGAPGAPRNWTLAARLASAPDVPASWTNLTGAAPLASLPAYADADLWFGMTAFGSGGLANASVVPASAAAAVRANATTIVYGTAAFSGFRAAVFPLPASPPADLYGSADGCAAPAQWRGASVTVPGNATGATLSGLSGFLPYTLTVTAWLAANATAPASEAQAFGSAPLPGVFFFARPMPPRSHMLSFWLDSRFVPYPTGGRLSRWADSSFFGHDVTQSVAANMPTVTAGTAYSAATVKFTRTSPSVMVGGADVFDLGLSGNFTVYISARGTTSAPQVVVGRGALTTNILNPAPGSVGWVAGVCE